jgi:hypothetical protein
MKEGVAPDLPILIFPGGRIKPTFGRMIPVHQHTLQNICGSAYRYATCHDFVVPTPEGTASC